jgi:2-polyprenyl-3-methyl-5-hydroxy-6-metoxy-1,4-benzoquinol methylase
VTASAEYWEQRARDYARDGAGLRAVCSYGMPSFYNGYIHLTQQLALSRHLRVEEGTPALDIGCGIGRWTRMLARRGARVVGVDLSPTMIDEARLRTVRAGLTSRVEYAIGDLRTLDLGREFPLVTAVTVLQHILDERDFSRGVCNLALHLARGGRAVLLEAAPSRANASCDTAVFRARTAAEYCDAFRAAGLRCVEMHGVDPAPFKQRVLPRYRSMSRPAAAAALFGATALSLPYDALLGRRMTHRSWHKVFVLEHDA